MGNQHVTSNLRGRRGRWALAVFAGLAAAAVSGCGGSTKTESTPQTQASHQTSAPPATATTPTTTATATTAITRPATPTQKPERAAPNEKIVLSSPAINPNGGELQSRYTCDGQDIPMPLKWRGVPPGTAELLIDVIKVKPVNGKLSFAWAVAGVPPKTHEIIDGKLPPGAITGLNGNGETKYRLCPPNGPSESYVAVIFALPHKLRVKPGFDSVALRHQAERQASYQNLQVFNYTRH
jgi:hypothetical protein